MNNLYDLIILGGGCAGLSLATQLVKSNSLLTVLVLEGRQSYTQDRTWCYFKNVDAVSRADAHHTWPTMRVASNDEQLFINCGTAQYEMVNSEQFYNNAQLTIEQSELVDLKTGIHVNDLPKKNKDLWCIYTNAGVFQSRFVVDTRSIETPQIGAAKLWQSFYGAEVECEFDSFDVGCGDLMDFAAANACGTRLAFPDAVCFVYILPTTATRALIELTVFSPTPLEPQNLISLHKKATLNKLGRVTYSVLRTEHGILPMGNKKTVTRHDATYVFAGLYAGGARPSSGYAFTRIQAWASYCAKSLANGNFPLGHKSDSLIQQIMDFLFLKMVRARPELAPDLFLALFARTETQSVIRFLSDRATLQDHVRVMASLFPGPLFRAFFGRKRSIDIDISTLEK